MQRMVLFGLMLGLVTALQAQITVSGSVDMVVIPFQLIQAVDGMDEKDNPIRHNAEMGAGLGQIEGIAGPRIRLDVRAMNETGTAGARLRLQALGHTYIGVENFLQAWWSPLDWLRLDAGRFDDDRMRGKIGWDDMHIFTVLSYNEDAIFNRIRARGGFMMSLEPIEGLLVTALLNDLNPLAVQGHDELHLHRPNFPELSYVQDRFENGNMWRNLHIAASYTIEGIGMFRAQYIGVIPDYTSYDPEMGLLPGDIRAPRFEAAFALSAISDLTLDIGGKLPLPINNNDAFGTNTWQAPYQISIGAQYDMDKLTIAGRVDTGLGGGWKVSGAGTEEFSFAPKVNIHLWPSYNFGAFKAILSAGLELLGEETLIAGNTVTVTGDGGIRFGAGISLEGTVIGGFRTRGGLAYRFPAEINGIKERGVFTIPLFLEYSF
ncbi:MAG: hypothetical protein FWG89_00620 [Treponema sp.]|nr:hypothetical protein [Treponema sp.]